MATLKRPRSSQTCGIPCGSRFQERNGDNILVNINGSVMNFGAPKEASDFRQPFKFRRLVPSDFFPLRARDDHVLNGGERNNDLECCNPNHVSPSMPVEILKMVAGSSYLPKDEPEKPQGDDAHFLCLEAQTIGVADGVGGWCKKGIDAGKYARDLMENSKVAAQFEPKGAVNPRRIMQEAYSKTKAEGSSTACIITLSGNFLHAVNVGDSGFILVRRGKVVYKSPVQQRFFNCPHQLGNCADDPSLAQELDVLVEKGDIVVAGTDGLFDNMHGSEIEEAINLKTSQGAKPYEIARALANLALYNSFDRFADTPFAIKSREAGYSHRGGKEDDITVIVACIQASN